MSVKSIQMGPALYTGFLKCERQPKVVNAVPCAKTFCAFVSSPLNGNRADVPCMLGHRSVGGYSIGNHRTASGLS